MLFTYNKFWKTITAMAGAWLSYGFFGYEFTAVTLLVLIVAQNYSNEIS